MSTGPVFLADGDAAAAVWWSRGSVIYVKLGAVNADLPVALAVQRCPPGYETPAHVHHSHDEVLMAREGDVQLHVGGEVHDADHGDAVYLPKGTPHGFRIGPDEPGALSILFESPLEMGFLESGIPVEARADELPEAPPAVRESEVLGDLPEAYDTEVVGPLPDA